MQTQILVPLDGSARAESILTPLIPLAQATGSELTLAQAISFDDAFAPILGMPLSPEPTLERQEELRQDVARYLTTVARKIERPGLRVRTTVLDGPASAAILNYAHDYPEVRLIAMATHGRRSVNRWIFGSVAEDILRQALVPVMLLRMPAGKPQEGPAPGLRTIVVPLDGSSFAESALDLATTLAQATGARLVLVTAVDGVDAASAATEALSPWQLQARQAQIDRLAFYQQDQAARIEAQGLTVGMQLRDGRPADVIRRLSAEVKADLIVMATHGRTGFQRLRLGSVALDVAEHATQPVCLVRVPAEEMQPSDLAARAAGVNKASVG